MANSEGQKKQDLQGWGMVFAVQQDVLNRGLKKAHDLIPQEYQTIDYDHKISAPLIGDIDVTIDKAELGVIQVDALRDGLKLAKVHIPLESGKLILASFGRFEKDLEGSTVDTTISLTQFKAVTQRATGTRYDVHLDIESDEAIYDVEIDIDPLYNQFLNSAVKSMLKGIGGKSYHICSFDIGQDFEYEEFIPTEMDYTFIFDETDQSKSVFCGLMATADVPAPSEAARFAFNRAEVMPDGQVAALSVNNTLFTRMLCRNLKSQGMFAKTEWTIEGDSPASLTLKDTINDFKDGADLTECTITAREGHIFVHMKLYKGDVTPGINLTFNADAKLELVWDQETQTIQIKTVGDPTVKHTVSESLWLTILKFIPHIVSVLTNIVIIILKAVIEDNIPDIGSMLAQELDKFEIPVTLPNILIDQGIILSTVQINEYGSISAGLTITEL